MYILNKESCTNNYVLDFLYRLEQKLTDTHRILTAYIGYLFDTRDGEFRDITIQICDLQNTMSQYICFRCAVNSNDVSNNTMDTLIRRIREENIPAYEHTGIVTG